MLGGSLPQLGNELSETMAYLAAVTYPTLAANASGTNTLSNLGNVLPGDLVSWNLQGPPAHIFLENAYCSAAGVITLSWTTDSTGITTGSIGIVFAFTRAVNQSMGLTALPSQVQ